MHPTALTCLPSTVAIHQVAIYDATNATEDVRNRLRQYVTRKDKANKVSYLWLEVKLTDEKQISDNIDYMASYSPDYEKMSMEEGSFVSACMVSASMWMGVRVLTLARPLLSEGGFPQEDNKRKGDTRGSK